MSLNLSTIPALPFPSKLYSTAIRLCTPFGDPPNYSGKIGPRTVRLDIPWTDAPYSGSLSNRDVGVAVNLADVRLNLTLDAIRFVKIDNSFNDAPVYFQMADSLDAITCPANAIVGVQVMSNVLQFTVYATGLFSGRTLQTSVFVSNAPQDPFYVPDSNRYTIIGSLVDTRYSTGIVVGANNFIGVKVGPQFADRYIVVAITGERSAGTGDPITSVNFTGAVPIPKRINSGGVLAQFACLFSVLMPANGQTGVMIVTSTAACGHLGMTIYSLAGTSDSPILDTEGDEDIASGTTVSPASIPGSYSIFAAVNSNVATVFPPPILGAELDNYIAANSATSIWAHSNNDKVGNAYCGAPTFNAMVGATFN